VKFLLDAQLSRSLCGVLTAAGHESQHTLDLPNGNGTNDRTISDLADKEERIVMSKDSDFVVSHLLYQKPRQLLHISTGNITNRELEHLLLSNLRSIQSAFDSGSHVELNQTTLILHS
jgi:predicted nuclease of predicted toxin-antitoxin system